jgi:carboxyl-terminal processing protease
MRLLVTFSIARIALSFLLLIPTFALATPAAPAGDTPAATAPKAAENDAGKTAETAETYRLLKLFGDVFERTREQYVEPKPDKELIEAALNGMLSHLDPHSGYMNADELKDMQVQTRGQFGGLGIEVTMETGAVKVVSPIDDTPAMKAGMQSGDLIVALDGKPVQGFTLQEAVNTMRGPPGTSIKLTVVRKGKNEPFEVVITRAIIRVESVKFRTEGDVGYIRITNFTDRTQEGLDKAITDIKGKLGDKLQGYVLDLRNNPGGLLDQAVSVSDTFLTQGEIVSTRARDTSENKRYNATTGDAVDGKPLVVMINAGSASASEIVSGALQDHRRAIVLGVKSFGKGSVQTVSPISGYGAIRLTTARYYTPSGRSIQAEGIVPDIVVEQAKLEAIEDKGFSIHEADLKGALGNDTTKKPEEAAPTPAPAPEAGKDGADKTSEKKDEAKDDYQLTRALDLIRGLSLYGMKPMQNVAANENSAVTPETKKDAAP